jgi:hypothetical protein
MDINLPHFHEEHQKLKERLASFDIVIEQEKQLKDEEKKLEDAKVSMHISSSEIERLDAEIKELRAVLGPLENEHEKKKATWEGLNFGNKAILFTAVPTCNGQNLEELKVTVERVKLNGLLFEQKLHIEELSASINNKQADIERISTELDAKMKLGSTLESNIRLKDNDLRAAKLS